MSDFENQDPYREADWESERGTKHWYDAHGEFHRDGDLPAVSHHSGWGRITNMDCYIEKEVIPL